MAITANGYSLFGHLIPLLCKRTGAMDGSSLSDVKSATLDEGDIDFPSCPWKLATTGISLVLAMP